MFKIEVKESVKTIQKRTAIEILMRKINLTFPAPQQNDVAEFLSGGFFAYHDGSQGYLDPYLIDLSWYSELNNGTISFYLVTNLKAWVIHVPITNIVFANEIINAAKKALRVTVVWKKDAQNKVQIVLGIMNPLPDSGEFFFNAKFNNGSIFLE